MASPYKMKNPALKMAAKGAPMQKNYAGSPLEKKGKFKTTTDAEGNKSKVYVSKNEKKAYISSDGGNKITKVKDGGVFKPNKIKRKEVNLTTGKTTVTKENIKTGKKTITTRKSNKKDNRIVKKGRKKTTPPEGTKIV